MNGGPPNGDAILYHHADTVKALTAERDALREALTASGSTKADYMGEFRIDFPLFDENGEEYIQPVNVPWTTIKEIMAAILNRALPTPPKETP
ncbi:MAG: hypothetical protein JKY94_02190 [Rhodobacteraceae bacterium]|nr:hypothetical protein [Paracoccaceae bacterium]